MEAYQPLEFSQPTIVPSNQPTQHQEQAQELNSTMSTPSEQLPLQRAPCLQHFIDNPIFMDPIDETKTVLSSNTTPPSYYLSDTEITIKLKSLYKNLKLNESYKKNEKIITEYLNLHKQVLDVTCQSKQQQQQQQPSILDLNVKLFEDFNNSKSLLSYYFDNVENVAELTFKVQEIREDFIRFKDLLNLLLTRWRHRISKQTKKFLKLIDKYLK